MSASIHGLSLSACEWGAVQVALCDAERYVSPDYGAEDGLLTKILRGITGNHPAPRLADPRLEVLRRFVDASRRRRQPADAMFPAMAEQGFNRAQIEAIALLAA